MENNLILNDNKQEVMQYLFEVCDYYEKKLPKKILQLYLDDLESIHPALIKKCLELHRKHPLRGRFFPKIADIYYFLNKIYEIRKISIQEQATIAWDEVKNAIKNCGRYSIFDWSSLDIHHVVECMGGFVSLCDSKENELPYVRKEFEQRYINFVSRKNENTNRELHII